MKLKDYFRLKKYEDEGFTETKFAAILGITSPYLSRLKNEKTMPSIELAFLIEQKTEGRVTVAEYLAAKSLSRRKYTKKNGETTNVN
jgi:transcriptional regulator with XRE-family HTH domain